MAAVALDVPLLSSFCSLPPATITTALDSPTQEIVQRLLENITVKAKNFAELESEKARTDIKFESAVRGQETKIKAIKTQIDKSHAENEYLQQRLGIAEAAKASAESQLKDVQTRSTTTTSELDELTARIGRLENSNRETLGLLDAKSTAYDGLANDLSSQHQKAAGIRKRVTELEQALEDEKSSHSATAFREESQKQTITRLEKSNEWLETELKTKNEEYTKLRKDKSSQISQLQRQVEESTTESALLKTIETNLRRTLDDITEKTEERSVRVQQLQEDILQKEKAFQVELDAANRLAKLRENAASTERNRAQDLAEQLESLNERASQEIGQIQAELETEHAAKEETDLRLAEFEVHVERLEMELSALREHDQRPSTPKRLMAGNTSTPGGLTEGSPTVFTPASSRMKGSVSVTQLVTENNELKRQNNAEKARNEHLTATIDSLMAEMEDHSPEIEEMKEEHARLESEVADLSALVDSIGKERDQAIKSAKKEEGRFEAKVKEGEVLRQQLRDLSSQVKMLLSEAYLHEQGQGSLTNEGRAQLQQLVRGDKGEGIVEGTTDTDKYISANLVTFRNIHELQEQNTKLLQVTREVGERMEREEALRKQTEAAQAFDELRQKYERCKDEIKSLITQSQSYVKERDMFRQMLKKRGQLPQALEGQMSPSSEGFGESTGVMGSIEAPLVATVKTDANDYATLLKELQTHFDSYRTEAATDRATMKQQIDDLSRTNSDLRSEAVRSNSQVVLSSERYEMLQTNYKMLKKENEELQKRAHAFYEGSAKQDLRIQQAAEDLIEARGLVDSMRNETANLKAEKDFWKTVEQRLTKDNESLQFERGRLNNLNANLQSLLHDREHTDSETRRRLHTQVERLETDLQKSTTELHEQSEEIKRLNAKREYEQASHQKRIDDLASSLSSLREYQARTSTEKDVANRKAEELSIELRSAKERLEVFQNQPIPHQTEQRATTNGANADLSNQQLLEVRVSELQRDLDLAKRSLQDAESQINQYKAISQASEEELSSLNETQDLYRQEVEQSIREKDHKLQQLQQHVDELNSLLSAAHTEMDALKGTQSTHDAKLQEQKAMYELQLSDVKDEDEKHAAAAQFYQEDLKVQSNIAQQAQQNYETELLKHAEAARTLQKVRSELSEVKIELVETRTIAETARLNLNASEDSWRTTHDQLEKELVEMKAAREGFKEQNDHLHRQLETLVESQKHAVSVDTNPSSDPNTTGLDDLQAVVKYLRREKEIVDVQLELATQESKRVKQQLDFTQTQLDETRLKLNQQRRTEAESERSAMDHKKLMDTIQELNMNRESNVTLRAEARQAQTNLASRMQEVEELKTRLEPLRNEIMDLKGDQESHLGEIKLLKETVDRWQQRYQTLISRNDRIDPDEYESVKEQLRQAQEERDNIRQASAELEAKISEINTQNALIQEQAAERVEGMKARLTEQFKARSKQLSDRIKEKDNSLQQMSAEKEEMQKRLAAIDDLQSQIETAKAERDVAVSAQRNSDAPGVSDTSRIEGGEEGEVGASGGDETKQGSAVTEQELQQLRQQVLETSSLRSDLISARAKLEELEALTAQQQATIDALNTEINQLQAAGTESGEAAPSTDVESQLNQLRQDLARAQNDAEALRASATQDGEMPTNTESASAQSNEIIRQGFEEEYQQKSKNLEETFQKRLDSMKSQLNKKLAESRTQIRQSLQSEHDQALAAVRAEHQKDSTDFGTGEGPAQPSSAAADAPASQDEKTVEPKLESTDNAPVNLAAWKPTDAQAKELVAKNETISGIVRRNIIAKMNQAKADTTAALKDVHEKALAEAQEKANTAKEHAVMMEAKKSALQINMANNQKRVFQYKVELVQKASQETPEKAVKEVWLVIKDAKPPNGPVAAPTPQLANTAPKTAQATTNSAEAIAPIATPSTAPKASAPVVFGQPTPTGQAGGQATAANTSSPLSAQAAADARPTSIPQKPPVAATGGASGLARTLPSGLPVARGSGIRGGMRGRGAPVGRGTGGVGRGGAAAAPAGPPNAQNQATTSRGGAAKQPGPGHKRPREESQDGASQAEAQGKRARGGTPSAS